MDKGPLYRISVLVISFSFYQLITGQDYCNTTWVTRPGRNVAGGSLDSNAITPQACRDSCLRFPTCRGFDIDGAARCWLTFTDAADQSSGGYTTHYQLIRSLNSCLNCSAGSSMGWLMHSNSHVNGGTPKDNLQTFEACLKDCAADVNCRGFDWDQNNPYGRRCWSSQYGTNPIQSDSPGVNHFEKIAKPCPDSGLKVVNPTPGQLQGSSPFSTVPTVSPNSNSAVPQPVAEANQYIHVKAQAIKPAYIVLAGLGGGCILLVIIAVATLCMYPLKGDGGGYSRTTKTKKTKTTKTVHSARSTEDEHIGMSTITEVPNESRNSYDNRKSNGSAALATATATTGYATDDDYNRNSGSNHHSVAYEDENRYSAVRNSGGSGERQSAGYNQDDYGTSRTSGAGSDRGYDNQGYNTITSTSSHKSGGYHNEGYNSVNSRGSKKSGYEDTAYDAERNSTLRSHGRVESIAEEAGEDDYNHSRASGIDTGTATYNQEDYY